MPRIAHWYVHAVDGFNRGLGKVIMWGVFVMAGILLWSSISKTFFNPSLWTLEVAQFAMVAYYVLGGPYSVQLGSNVRSAARRRGGRFSGQSR
jgi:TRAP-type C4-dicarboxylate transport system permease small subunit